MQVKDFHARVKAAGTEQELDEGQYRALVSVFNTEDSTGDVITAGAFTKTLNTWSERGDPIPIIWSHEWNDPYAHIGHVLEAEETDDGLVITGQLDLANPKAEQVYRLLKGRRVTQHSFAYDVVDGAKAERDGRNVHELRELSLYEVGPCLVGANQSTELLEAKAREAATHGLTADQETLRAAYDALGTLLSDEQADDESEQAEQAETSASTPDTGTEEVEEVTGQEHATAAADDDPEPGKSAAQPRMGPAQVLASITVQRLKGHSDVAGTAA